MPALLLPTFPIHTHTPTRRHFLLEVPQAPHTHHVRRDLNSLYPHLSSSPTIFLKCHHLCSCLKDAGHNPDLSLPYYKLPNAVQIVVPSTAFFSTASLFTLASFWIYFTVRSSNYGACLLLYHTQSTSWMTMIILRQSSYSIT